MKKIQLYLPENIYGEFAVIAFQKQQSIPVAVREYLKSSLEKKKDKGAKTLIKLSKYNVDGGDLANNIDNILYK
ncbi:hypothetical protein M1145_00790 [Patescibacteria group bacterium]|nr:hypothetical protein [Patescibacteria group bacterium]